MENALWYCFQTKNNQLEITEWRLVNVKRHFRGCNVNAKLHNHGQSYLNRKLAHVKSSELILSLSEGGGGVANPAPIKCRTVDQDRVFQKQEKPMTFKTVVCLGIFHFTCHSEKASSLHLVNSKLWHNRAFLTARLIVALQKGQDTAGGKKTKENRETPSLEEEVAFYWQQMNFAVICYHKLPGTVKQQSFKYSIFKIYLFIFLHK